MAITTERAILVICAHTKLVAAVQAMTADVEKGGGEGKEALERPHFLLDRFSIEV